METTFYFTAVVPSTDPELAPYVSTPLGPYHPDEVAAHERAKTWLRSTYATEDVRQVEPQKTWDFTDVRSYVMIQVHQEHTAARLTAERERAEAALNALGPEVWGGMCAADLDDTDLNAVIEALGVNPDDV